MGAGFEAQWDAAWFAERAAQCRRLARGATQPDIVRALSALAEDFEAQSRIAAQLQGGNTLPEG